MPISSGRRIAGNLTLGGRRRMAEPNVSQSRPAYAWVAVLVAFLCFGVVYGTTLYSFPIFVKPVSDAFHVSPTAVLFGFTLLNVGTGILGIAAGPAVARFGIRNSIVAG